MGIPINQPEEFASHYEFEEASVKSVQAYLRCLREGRAPGPVLKQAWEQFYPACEIVLPRIATHCHVPECDAADVVQAAWVEAIIRLPEFRWRGCLGFLKWLYTLVRRQKINRAREKCRHPVQGLGGVLGTKYEPCDPAKEPSLVLERSELCQSVRVVLKQLQEKVPELNFRVFYLHLIEEKPLTEVAASLGMNPGQAKARLHRMVVKFRAAWKPHSGRHSGTSPANGAVPP